MAVTARNIFGTNAMPEAATPGSYGEAPKGARLPAETQLGAVRLQISDLDRSVDFYTRVLGLEVIEREDHRAKLSARNDARVLIELNERRGAHAAQRGRLGLYHFAILLSDRASLGRLVPHLIENGVQPGAGDHLVSEAFYLSDPDGLGIEVYVDRQRNVWRRNGRELMMATDPVNVEDLLRAAGGERWSGMPAGTVMGHVHLHVGDLAQSAAFYSDALGFDRTVWSYPAALFMSAGGYHHHLGTNLWAGPTATAPTDNEAQLLEWTIEVPTADDVDAVEQRVKSAGYDVVRDATTLVMKDPWGTGIRVVSK